MPLVFTNHKSPAALEQELRALWRVVDRLARKSDTPEQAEPPQPQPEDPSDDEPNLGRVRSFVHKVEMNIAAPFTETRNLVHTLVQFYHPYTVLTAGIHFLNYSGFPLRVKLRNSSPVYAWRKDPATGERLAHGPPIIFCTWDFWGSDDRPWPGLTMPGVQRESNAEEPWLGDCLYMPMNPTDDRDQIELWLQYAWGSGVCMKFWVYGTYVEHSRPVLFELLGCPWE